MWNVKLRTKLIGGFAVVAAITLLVGGLGWKELSETSDNEGRARLLQTVSMQLLQREIDHLNWAVKVGEFQRNEEMTELGVEKDEHKCKFGSWYYSEDRKRLESALPAIKPLLERIEEPHRKMHESAKKIEEVLKEGKPHRSDAIAVFEKETLPSLKGVQQLLGEIRPRMEEHTLGIVRETEAQTARAKMILLGGMVAGTLIAMVLGVFLSLMIIKPINHVINGLSRGADELASSSLQVSLASQSLAEGTSQQAAAIEQTSSSLEEMSSMTRQNAQNANQADILMRESIQAVHGARQSMDDMSISMTEISQASEDTQKIIKTIDEIAFQTNLLALNAAVEAARAGEAGAGFAVVADEVRNLAMRAAEAAKNTQSLIESIVRKIRVQGELVSRNSRGFSQVSSSIQRVADLLNEITAASGEQAQGIEQINKAVTESDKVTQHNATSADESAAASEEMSGQAKILKEFVMELTTLIGGSTDVEQETEVAPSNRHGTQQRYGRPTKTVDAAKKGFRDSRTNLLASPQEVRSSKTDSH